MKGFERETTESPPTPQFSTCLSGAAVALVQWLVRANCGDRVLTPSNPSVAGLGAYGAGQVRLPHIASVLGNETFFLSSVSLC